MPNRYGLDRQIPDGVKREVRQRCGFGCVLCASSIFDYEHFDPDFTRAREHRPEGITLLCPSCHAKKTRNLMSARRVREADQTPAAKAKKYGFSEIEGTPNRPFVRFAGMLLRNCITPVRIRGFPILSFEEAEAAGGPYRLSASFFNERGRPSLFIRKNEWQVLADTWDVEVVGSSVTVRNGPGQIALQLRFVPGVGLLVDRLEMHCAGYRLSGNAETLEVVPPNGGLLSFTGCISDNCNIGLALD